MTRWIVLITALATTAYQADAFGQTSSLGARERIAQAGKPPPTVSREAPKRERNLT